MQRVWAGISAALLAALVLSGCSPAPAALPEGVTVSVFQSRFDRGLHQIEIKMCIRDRIVHALTGDSHVVGDPGPGHPTGGWWGGIVGPGLAVDTDRWFVVAPLSLIHI